jgi:hypothetical protein
MPWSYGTNGECKMNIVKSHGPTIDQSSFEGYCYDGTGFVGCDFWKHNTEGSWCMLFGKNGIHKLNGKSLVICDKIYGVDYYGNV